LTELCSRTAAELVRLVRDGQISRREVASAHLDRIDAGDGEIGAFSRRLDPEQVLAEAAAADRERAGDDSFPLDGVPISVKEYFDVTGMASTEGVRAHADRRAPGDSLVVQRLRRAGALIVGKGKQPDFKARWNTVSELDGVTRNPRDTRLSAGGSSGGDAAAVAGGFVAAGLGTDFGGSIRVPASFCGTWGLRTSHGRVPDVQAIGPPGGAPIGTAMSSIGPLCRSREDLRLVLGAIAGAAPAAPASVDPVGPGLGPRRVARLSDQLGARVEPGLLARLDAVCDAFAAAGYEVVDADLPGGSRLPELFGELVGTELLQVGLPALGETIGADARHYLETMFGERQLGGSVADFLAAQVELSERASVLAAWMELNPLIVSPVVGIEAPPLDFDQDLSPRGAARLFDRMRNAVWVNLLGLPAISLPNGIQIAGRRFAEAELLDAAAAVEPHVLGLSAATI